MSRGFNEARIDIVGGQLNQVMKMMSDMDVGLRIKLRIASSAARGASRRRGLGKLRHVELSQLWLQELVANGRISLFKVKGEDNFSDSLTKHATADRINQTMRCSNQVVAVGRHPIMPFVAS